MGAMQLVGMRSEGRNRSEYVTCLVWTARELVGNVVTADLTAQQRVRQEHSTSIKKKHN